MTSGQLSADMIHAADATVPRKLFQGRPESGNQVERIVSAGSFDEDVRIEHIDRKDAHRLPGWSSPAANLSNVSPYRPVRS